jgi:hypothetical protein
MIKVDAVRVTLLIDYCGLPNHLQLGAVRRPRYAAFSQGALLGFILAPFRGILCSIFTG